MTKDIDRPAPLLYRKSVSNPLEAMQTYSGCVNSNTFAGHPPHHLRVSSANPNPKQNLDGTYTLYFEATRTGHVRRRRDDDHNNSPHNRVLRGLAWGAG